MKKTCVAFLSAAFGAVAVSGQTCLQVDEDGAATFPANTTAIVDDVSNKHRPTFAGGAGREHPCSGADDRHRRRGTLTPSSCSRLSPFPVFFLLSCFLPVLNSSR